MKLSNYIESTTPKSTCEGAKLVGYVPKRSEKLVSVSLKSKEVFADVFWWSQENFKSFSHSNTSGSCNKIVNTDFGRMTYRFRTMLGGSALKGTMAGEPTRILDYAFIKETF